MLGKLRGLCRRKETSVAPATRSNSLYLESLEDRTVPSTFTVTNLDDAGAGSLRQAIIDANANAGPDDVVFQAGLAGMITLTSGALDVTDDLIVTGPGAALLTIDGNNSDSIFEIGGVGVDATLSGLTLTNGSGFAGGAITVGGGTLTVENSTLTGNTAAYGGGAILSYFGDVTIVGSTITGNTAPYGGGVLAYGANITITNSTVTGNTAYGGGGIFAYDGSVTVTNSTISGNSAYAGSGGGAVFVVGGNIDILDGSIISNNMANYDAGGLGALYGDITITDSTISGNTANSGSGGGVFANVGTVTVTNSTITGNTAIYSGGGVYTYDGMVKVTGSIFENNVAVNKYGGGIGSQTGDIMLSGSTFRGNMARFYGGAVSTSGAVTAVNSVVSNNISDYSGGGIATFGGVVTITDSTISGNVADADGGGIFQANGDIVVINSTISGNTALLGNGGGMQADGDITVTDSTVSNNSAYFNGGGLYARFGNAVLVRSAVVGNCAYFEGGGVRVVGDVEIHQSLIADNTANRNGGGVYAIFGSGLIVDSTISGNVAGAIGPFYLNGGGLWIDYDVTIVNSTISGNTAPNRGGGLFTFYGPTVAIDNSTITDNTAYATVFRNGGGISVDVYDLSVRNSIITGNSSPVNPDVYYSDNFSVNVNNLIGVDAMLSPLGNYGGGVVGSADAPYIRPVHALLPGSAAIDAGSNPLALANDQRGTGFLRTAGPATDIGAFEVQTADVAVTKTAVADGTNVTFTIVVTNNGPGRTATTVVDTFPAEILNAAYTSIAAGGAMGNSTAGVGNINDLLDLPAGASVTYTVSAVLSAPVENVVEALIPTGTVDPDASNNVAAALADPTNVVVADGALVLRLTPFDDVVTFDQIGGQLLVTVNGRAFGPFSLSAIDEIVVDALEGDDLIQINDPFDLVFIIDGNAGVDTLDLSAVMINTTVVIGPGIETPSTFASIEVVRTGAGDDTFLVTQLVDGRIDGGGGLNTLDLSHLAFTVDVFLSGSNTGRAGGLFFDNIQRGFLPLFQPNALTSDGTVFRNVLAWTANGQLTVTEFGETSIATADDASDALDARRFLTNGTVPATADGASNATATANDASEVASTEGEDGASGVSEDDLAAAIDGILSAETEPQP